jgi:transposase
MGLSRRRFTREFKISAVRRLQQGESVAVLARALEVNPSVLQRWREEFRQGPKKAFPGSGRRGAEPDRVAQLERKVGQQALEIDFLKGCLQSIEEQRHLQAREPEPRSTRKSKGGEREGSR